MKLPYPVKRFSMRRGALRCLTAFETLTYDPRVARPPVTTLSPVSAASVPWLTPEQFLSGLDPFEISPLLRILLTSDGSMTTLLGALRLAPIDLEVVRQDEEPLDVETARHLGVRAHQPTIARHAWLTHTGHRLLYAASVLPTASLSPALADGVRRASEPLGRLLDGCGRPVMRDRLRIGRLDHPALAEALGGAPDDRLWCRSYRLTVEQTLTASIFEVFSPRLID